MVAPQKLSILKPSPVWDAVIVGSGFGAAMAAHRLSPPARAC